MFPFFIFLVTLTTQAQPKSSAISPSIDSILSEIKRFQKAESKTDSIAGHPLGSFKEEDFLRRYNFYVAEKQKLDAIQSSSLSFEDQINKELLNYYLEDEISNYRFKSYLNPILSDEGFHTVFAGMSGQVITTKKEAEDYLLNLRDIPRFVDENLALMRTGLSLGICQPKIILNGYQNTYTQHIVDNPEKSVFWNPFLKKPFAISDADWEKIKTDAKKVISEDVVTSYTKIKILLDSKYLKQQKEPVDA